VAISRRHPAALLAVLIAALGTTGVAYATVASSSIPKAVAPSQTQISQGNDLFKEGCASCHGLAAQGSSDGPAIIGVGAAAVDFQVGTGRMPMAAPAIQAPSKKVSYSVDEIAALAAYVASLGAGPAIPTQEQVSSSGADLALGGELFRTNCAQCHSVSGRGGALSWGAYAPSMLKSSPKHIYEAMLTGPQSMPVFGDKTMTPSNKRDIIRYIEELQKRENPGGADLGRLGPVTEGVFLFIAGLGALIAISVWIGARAR